jgi:hypothetical protein
VVFGDTVFRGVLGACALDVYDKGVLDAEDGIRGLEGVVAEVEGAISYISNQPSERRGQKRP